MKPLSAALILAVMAACTPKTGPLPAMDTHSIATLSVQPESSSAARPWDGQIEAVQQAELTAQTAGTIDAVLVDINATVSRGQLVIKLAGIEQRAGAAAAAAGTAAAKARALEAETTYARYLELSKKNYVSTQQLDQALATRNAAQANWRAAQAQAVQASQQQAYAQIRAPFSGIISQRLVEPGESVAPGQPLLRIFNPQQFRIQLQVPQSLAESLHLVSEADIQLADGTQLKAADVQVYPSADAEARSVTVRIALPEGRQDLMPGQVARVSFPGMAKDQSVWLPLAAVWQRGEVRGVYVVTDTGVQLRQLRLGDSSAGRIQVLSGLQIGERVASDPAQAAMALTAYRKSVNTP